MTNLTEADLTDALRRLAKQIGKHDRSCHAKGTAEISGLNQATFERSA